VLAIKTFCIDNQTATTTDADYYFVFIYVGFFAQPAKWSRLFIKKMSIKEISVYAR